MSIFRLLGYTGLHLVPYSTLEHWLTKHFSVPGYIFSARFSGRTALFELAATFRKTVAAPIALYPDYICNIVPRVLVEAGWNAVPYPTNESLESSWDDLSARMEQGDIGLLVGASVFGSSGLLDDLVDPVKLTRLRSLGVKVIADLSQDVSLVHKLPTDGSDLISAVVSFNNKSFPGAMGGGILANYSLSKPHKKLNAAQQFYLYRKTIRSSLLRYIESKDKLHMVNFEYSLCTAFPFRITDCYRPSKLQIACAVQGMLLYERYRAAKRGLLRQRAHVQTRFASSAAYLIVRGEGVELQNRRRKAAYAIDGNSEVSLRPCDLIVHNKGFDDHA